MPNRKRLIFRQNPLRDNTIIFVVAVDVNVVDLFHYHSKYTNDASDAHMNLRIYLNFKHEQKKKKNEVTVNNLTIDALFGLMYR